MAASTPARAHPTPNWQVLDEDARHGVQQLLAESPQLTDARLMRCLGPQLISPLSPHQSRCVGCRAIATFLTPCCGRPVHQACWPALDQAPCPHGEDRRSSRVARAVDPAPPGAGCDDAGDDDSWCCSEDDGCCEDDGCSEDDGCCEDDGWEPGQQSPDLDYQQDSDDAMSELSGEELSEDEEEDEDEQQEDHDYDPDGDEGSEQDSDDAMSEVSGEELSGEELSEEEDEEEEDEDDQVLA